MFAVVVFRGEVKESDYNHLNRLVRDGKMVLLLGQKDLEVFLRQAIKGIYKESHIQERFDSTIRRLC
jgi:L-asparaginase II